MREDVFYTGTHARVLTRQRTLETVPRLGNIAKRAVAQLSGPGFRITSFLQDPGSSSKNPCPRWLRRGAEPGGPMNFTPAGQPRWKRDPRPHGLTPKMVKKMIHGQMVWVKVYPPRWSSIKTTDGVPNYLNPKFSGKNDISHTGRSAHRKKRENPAN